MNRLLHTPDGFRDIYREEARSRRALVSRLTGLISSFGYDEIIPPAMEFFDIFGRDIGTTPSKELYKFIDRDGNTLVLRPDFTPQIARAATTYFEEQASPIRLFYEGNVYINHASLQGRLREAAQLGLELIGEASTDADAEVLSLASRIFKEAGLSDYQISVSHAGILTELFRLASFSDEEETEVRDLIRNRNFFGLSEILDSLGMKGPLRDLFSLLGPGMSTIDDWILSAGKDPSFKEIGEDLAYLKKLFSILSLYGEEDHIRLDFGMVTDYRYYTGIVFSGFSYGSGEPLVKGGRYDTLFSRFGKDEPAIGFAFTVDELLRALDRQGRLSSGKKKKALILYKERDREKALKMAEEMREKGRISELILLTGETEDLDRLREERPGDEIFRVLEKEER